MCAALHELEQLCSCFTDLKDGGDDVDDDGDGGGGGW